MNVHVTEFLSEDIEPLPAWLDAYVAGGTFPYDEFFACRVVYYPGSGTDGHPVEVFGASHAAHCFVYADYLLEQARIIEELTSHPFHGYSVISTVSLGEDAIDLAPSTPHLSKTELADSTRFADPIRSYFLFVVLERIGSLTDSHGPKRLALLFVASDAIVGYDALFCQRGQAAPFAVLIHDHGFGCNYDRFGRGGLLEVIADRAGVRPRYLLVDEHSKAWSGFTMIEHVSPTPGGMHHGLRQIWTSADRHD